MTTLEMVGYSLALLSAGACGGALLVAVFIGGTRP